MPERPLNIAVVGVHDGWSSRALYEAVAQRAGHCTLVDLGEAVLDLERGRLVCGDLDLTRVDAVIVKKLARSYTPEILDRLELLEFVASRGVPVFSNPARIRPALNRLSNTAILRRGGIPMPPTVVTECLDEAAEAVRRFREAVLKPLFTSKARGMQRIAAGPDLRERLAAYQAGGHRVLYIQQFQRLPGRDLGVVFLGGRYLATYARIAGEGSWITSTSSGGRYAPVEPPPELRALADRAQRLFGLDFTCVDIAESDDGPLVFEVSAFGGFRGLLAGGVDAAGALADYVIERLREPGGSDAR